MIKGLSHIMLFSVKHAESVKWYCEKLGFEIDYNSPGEYCSLHHPTMGRLALHATNNPMECGRGPLPYYLVEDIHQTVKKLRDLGIAVGDPHKEGESPLFTQFKDLDGNILGLEEI
jgi:hypothetical protein